MGKWVQSEQVWTSLRAEFGLRLGVFHVEPLERYEALLREWNPLAGLLSASDMKAGIDAHVADSWTLIPYLQGGSLLDVGSGGGFPGIPLAVASPAVTVTLIDRSDRKSAFLKRVGVTLKLGNLNVVTGSFPEAGSQAEYACFTARAVEKPESLRADFAHLVECGSRFLCQSEDALPKGDALAVREVEDVFTDLGIRRGRLWIVQRPEPPLG